MSLNVERFAVSFIDLYMYVYIYIHIKCIATNKYASRVLEYNYTNSQNICT